MPLHVALCFWVFHVAFVHTSLSAVAKNSLVRDSPQCTAFCALKGGEETSGARRGGGGEVAPRREITPPAAVLLFLASWCVSLSSSNGHFYNDASRKTRALPPFSSARCCCRLMTRGETPLMYFTDSQQQESRLATGARTL